MLQPPWRAPMALRRAARCWAWHAAYHRCFARVLRLTARWP